MVSTEENEGHLDAGQKVKKSWNKLKTVSETEYFNY